MKLTREFYSRDTLTVAKELLGKHLIHKVEGVERIGEIVEVEAYGGIIDKAAHSYQGKRTKRTEVMFGEAGHAYVYLIYGMYHCLNIVTSTIDNPEAILIRALKPISGIPQISQDRYGKIDSDLTKRQYLNLLNGPGKLSKGMAITKEHNGIDLCADTLYLVDPGQTKEKIVTSPRINIDYAEEAIDYPWRYYFADNPYISKK
ncbi:DNA-3-methyladenine glycosylase [Desulfonispora thiosulfatigenes DSM 11270]|uniref:Putative 3-methyladenine DNA glycosylase n=1 Tax=Desulfonispora thiosulfatigenes DSM 11270 TaxID=656914 RepID=A0A1W1V3I6_DESTI|nr:DNA-3-methyladenine glycosylase [Desulfonispora thiosulfatigenes]SMB87967.1 DNA-3-methyladenine glycosylase [Desulfonispora thiosulfatigenes DSM 11270]